MRMYIFTTSEGTIADTRGANQKSPKLERRVRTSYSTVVCR